MNRAAGVGQLGVALALIPFLAACDGEPPAVQPSTAAANVTIVEPALQIAGLDRTRTIRLYLPPNYGDTAERYPVLYMHDGQNLFDDRTSYAGEWGVDETLNELAAAGELELIVVGIDNGAELRMRELSPWPNPDIGPPEGHAYIDFIVETVKPYVDANYRTLPGREHTAIMGSSMGGLISHWAILEYPHVFSKAGVFSPSYWVSDAVFDESDPQRLEKDARLYLVVGEKEGSDMVDGFRRMKQALSDGGLTPDRLVARVVPDGEHSEALWRQEFKAAVRWLFADD